MRIIDQQPGTVNSDRPLETLMDAVRSAPDGIIDRSSELAVLRRVSPETNLVIPDFTTNDTLDATEEIREWCEANIIDGDESGLGLIVEIVDEQHIAPRMTHAMTIYRGHRVIKCNVTFTRDAVIKTKLGQVIACYDVEVEACR
jgi:hypothetical protein